MIEFCGSVYKIDEENTLVKNRFSIVLPRSSTDKILSKTDQMQYDSILYFFYQTKH